MLKLCTEILAIIWRFVQDSARGQGSVKARNLVDRLKVLR